MLFSVHVWKSALVCGPHPRSLSASWQQIRCSTQSDKSDWARLLPCPVADEYVYWNALWRLLTLMLLLPSLSWSLFCESFVHGTWTELNSSSEHVVFQWKCLQYTNWTELDWSLQTIVLNTCFAVRVLTLHGLNWTKLTDLQHSLITVGWLQQSRTFDAQCDDRACPHKTQDVPLQLGIVPSRHVTSFFVVKCWNGAIDIHLIYFHCYCFFIFVI